MHRHHRQAAGLAGLAGLPVIGIVLLAGCSGGAASSSSAGSDAAAPAVSSPNGVHGAAAGAMAPAAAASSRKIARTGADLVYTAQLTVRASSVAAAVTRATAVVTTAGGYVSAENDSTGPAQPDQSSATLTLEIPVAAYPATLARLDSGSLGTQLSLQQQTQDVTQQVADVGSQVTSDEAAIAQLRTLLNRAASVSELLTVQNQINSEESGLESMLAQQKALDDETAYATATVTVLGPRRAAPPAPKAKPKPPVGLASGLSGGWRAFRLAVDWLLAVVGAAAPFAVAAAFLGCLGYLGYLLRRRRSRSALRTLAPMPALGEVGDELRGRLAAAGEERDLYPGVPTGLRAAQMTHQVDDPVQFVGLEREHPLEVVQREARDGVRPHVRVLPRHHAVLGEQLAPLGVIEQVPLVGADERVHAGIVPRRLLREERGNVALVELGGPVQRHRAEYRLACAPEPRPPEGRVHLLQLVGGARYPPQHVVRVGAHALQVVAAARHDALARRLVQHLGELGARRVPVAGAVEQGAVGDLEHRPHRVADHLVELACLKPLLFIL
jgi:hypothetical protein